MAGGGGGNWEGREGSEPDGQSNKQSRNPSGCTWLGIKSSQGMEDGTVRRRQVAAPSVPCGADVKKVFWMCTEKLDFRVSCFTVGIELGHDS